MSRLSSASDYRREIEELEELLREHEEIAEEHGSDFSAQLTMRSLQSRLNELQEALLQLEDEDLPGQELDVVLTGGPVDTESIRADFLGSLLKDMQRLISALVGAQFGKTSVHGPWPEEVRRRSALRVVETFPGSFGVRLEAMDDQLELEGVLAIQPAFEDLFQVLSSDRMGAEFLEELAPLGPRARSHLRRFLDHVARAEAEVDLRWPLLRGERQTRIRPSQARELSATLKRIEEEDRFETHIGSLEGANLRTGLFELTTDDERVIAGRVSAGVQPRLKELFGTRVEATLLVTLVTDRGTGTQREAFRLVDLNPADGEELA